ncbi:MAG: hypothetical protein SF052_19065 [Bacteroidia bacterium]|nr:hypothetical protein [Bacteroidia bacterium]
MRKQVLFILILVTMAGNPLIGQHFSASPRISLSLAFQEHDRRMFGLPQGTARDILFYENNLGTWQYALGVYKPLWTTTHFSLEAGFWLTREVNTFTRPINHQYLTGQQTLELRYIQRYRIDQVGIPVNLRMKLWDIGSSARVYAQGQALPAFHFRKGVNHLRILNKWVADFYSLEVNTGLGVAWKNGDVTLSYRAWQMKQIDTVLSPYIYDEVPSGTETYNPFKLWLTVSYALTPESEVRQFLRRRREGRDSLKE